MSLILSTKSREIIFTNFLISELIASSCVEDYVLWIISPWITNFELSIAEGGDIRSLLRYEETKPSLFDVLLQIAANNKQVNIVFKEEKASYSFRERLSSKHIQMKQHRKLHSKLFVGKCGVITGSANLTKSGVGNNEEMCDYYCDKVSIQSYTRKAQNIFGGQYGN